jgi:CheY-like chemotaxis protein
MMERMILSKLPYDCVTATNGVEAIAMAAAERPDLILMDVVMPQMNGSKPSGASATRLRATPIIMVTTRGEAQNIESAYAVGCNDYVTKPINSAELMAKLRSFLQPEQVRP